MPARVRRTARATALLAALLLAMGSASAAVAGSSSSDPRYSAGTPTSGPGFPDDRRLPAHHDVVAVGDFLTDPIVDRACAGNPDGGENLVTGDGGFIERKAHFTGELRSSDPRLTGDMTFDIVGFYDGSLGTFDGEWTLRTATGEARGTLVGTVDRLLVRGWITGRLEDGSRLSGNYSAAPRVGADGKVHYSMEVGGATAYRSTALVEQGACAPYAGEPYSGQLPTGGSLLP